MPDAPGLPADGGEQRELVARLQAVNEAKDTELAALRSSFGVLRAELDAIAEDRRLLELTVAELERRLGQDSTNSGDARDAITLALEGHPWLPPVAIAAAE